MIDTGVMYDFCQLLLLEVLFGSPGGITVESSLYLGVCVNESTFFL